MFKPRGKSGVLAKWLSAGALSLAASQASAASTTVSAADLRKYWLGVLKSHELALRQMVISGAIPAANDLTSITLSDDPPSFPGMPPAGPPARPGGDDDEFSPGNPEPIPGNQLPDAAHLRITVKSYIGKIGNNVGIMTNPVRAAAFALATDALFSENPPTDAKIKDYRLFTQTDADVACSNGLLLKWRFSNIISDTGTEPPGGGLFAFQAPKGHIRGAKFARVNASTVSFEWYFYGKPPLVPEFGIQRIQARTSVYIWHHIKGTISCGKGPLPIVKGNLAGSAFPSHRWWVNNVIQTTVPQGPMAGLWTPMVLGSNVVK